MVKCRPVAAPTLFSITSRQSITETAAAIATMATSGATSTTTATIPNLVFTHAPGLSPSSTRDGCGRFLSLL